jgi:hypothetical protein
MGVSKVEKEWKVKERKEEEEEEEEGRNEVGILVFPKRNHHAVAYRGELAEENALYGAQADGEG